MIALCSIRRSRPSCSLSGSIIFVSSRRTACAQFQAVFSLKLFPSVPISNSPRRAASSEHEFREGSAMSKAMAVFSRNLLPFGIVTAIASLPTVLLFNGHEDVVRNPAAAGALALSGGLSALSQAIVLYGAFEDMRGRPVDLMLRSFQHASRRFLPVIGVAFLSTVLAGLASLLLIIPGLILFTAWYVAIPACVVERLGPWTSLQRSAALTKGNRWKVARLIIVLAVITGIGGGLVAAVTAEAGMTIGLNHNGSSPGSAGEAAEV